MKMEIERKTLQELTGNELKVLIYLKRFASYGETRQQQCEKLNINRTTLYNCIHSLEEKGYLQEV